MERVRLFDKTFRTFIPNREIESAIDKVAERINADFNGCEDIPVLLCVLNGSILFTAELMKRLTFNCEIVSTKLSSYVGTESTGKVRQVMGLTADITGRRVIIVEDIVDTGTTLKFLKDYLEDRNPKSVKICTLLDKPSRRKAEVYADYIGFTVDDLFIIGYGLDYDQKYRNLPYVGYLEN